MALRNAPFAALAALSFVLIGAPLQAQEDAPVIQDGSTVSIEYTLKLDDGSTADSNAGGEPLVYVQGEQQILPALEDKLLGMKAEETREVTLTPAEGYGPVHEEALQTVPLDIIPEEARNVGARLVGQGPQGQPLHAVVKEINEENAVVDLNHPLAGQNLHFTIKVVSIK
jgi:FKBP-type peptidyl-prolyl cis-trans isomerase SlyD